MHNRNNSWIHSLPWTLALGLAQAGEGDSSLHESVDPKPAAVQETEIRTRSVRDAGYYDAHFPGLTQQELVAAMESGKVALVDANGSASYAEGHIPGALDFEAAGGSLAALLPADKSSWIVAYCGGPGCRAWNKAADKLQELGYTRVQHYAGGIREWKASGRSVEVGG